MAVDLSDFVDTLKREVSPPGSTALNAVSEDELVGYLADAFWEVRLDGFVEPYSCDVNGVILPLNDPQVITGDTDYVLSDYNPSVDISRQEIALVCLYAGIKIIRNQLTAQSSRLRAKAGPVEFEQDFSATYLVEMLKELQATKNRLLFLRTYNQDVHMIDAFSVRSASPTSYNGYLYDWYLGAFGSNMRDGIDGSPII